MSNKSPADKKTPIYRYNKINFKNLEITELKTDSSQPIAFINYNDETLNSSTRMLVQTGKIKLTGHGIPKLDKADSKTNYYPTDDKREFIKIPLDSNQQSCVELRKHLELADEWAGSDEMRKKLFGKKANKYQYSPCIKTPQTFNDEDEDESDKKKEKSKYPIIDYVKMKFNISIENNSRINRTKLVKVSDNKKTTVEANTITEIANQIHFLSEIKCIFHYMKIWANKTPGQGATKIMYGLGFKIMSIEFTPGINKMLDPDDLEFSSDKEEDIKVDDDDEVKKITKKVNKVKIQEDNSDDEKVKKGGKKEVKKSNKVKIQENDSEDEDFSEEIKEVKNKKSKKELPKKDEDEDEDEDDEDEDEEEIKPKKVKSKTSKAR